MIRKNLLQEKRHENGYLARKVAKDFDFSRATLYRKESGKTPLRNSEVVKFAQYYGIEEEQIREAYKVVER